MGVTSHRFNKVRNFDDSPIAEFFFREVFSLLIKKELFNLELVRKILI